jgi:hypothetical protein
MMELVAGSAARLWLASRGDRTRAMTGEYIM